jgi:uncharacterized protein with FMN-binding domain
MRRITYWLLSTISALVLLFGYHTSTSGALASGSSSTQPVISAGSGSSASTATSSGSAPPADSGTPSSSSGSSSKTVTGSVTQTRWGPVQVQLKVAAGKITGVSVLQYPSGNGRDAEINNYALPILTQETISSQNANIDMVSGATVTSDGYLQSLQSALDQANL